MTSIGKFIVVAGILLVVIGAAIWGLGKLGYRGLPGDMTWQTNGMRVYVPIATMIVLSIVLTVLLNLVFWLLRWWGK